MQVLKFYATKANSTSDLAALDNSILIPTEDSLLCSEDEGLEPLPLPLMHKSQSVTISNIVHQECNDCELLQAKLAVNDEPFLFKMRMQLRLLESGKPTFVFHFIRRSNPQLKYIETTPSKKNINGNSIILRGFEGLKTTRFWCYIQYGQTEMRCTLKPEKYTIKRLHFNARNSPFVAVNFYNVTSYNGMFSGMNELEEVVIENWDTSLITSMEEMFVDCRSLKSVHFIGCDFSAVTSMIKLCGHCTSLKELHFINCKMNITCDYWRMLYDCPEVISLKFPEEVYEPIMYANEEDDTLVFTWQGEK